MAKKKEKTSVRVYTTHDGRQRVDPNELIKTARAKKHLEKIAKISVATSKDRSRAN